jgi:hypothetical protein
VIDDWLDNGTIDGTYKSSCYPEALKHVPEDQRDYTGIGDAIAAALQSSLRGQEGPVGSVGNGGSGGASGNGESGGAGTRSTSPTGPQRTLQVAPDHSYYRRAIDDLGPTSADSLPIPLLVLAGLGSVLLLTAGASPPESVWGQAATTEAVPAAGEPSCAQARSNHYAGVVQRVNRRLTSEGSRETMVTSGHQRRKGRRYDEAPTYPCRCRLFPRACDRARW